MLKPAYQQIENVFSVDVEGTFSIGPKIEFEVALAGVKLIDFGIEDDRVLNIDISIEWDAEPTVDEAAQQFVIDNIWRAKMKYGVKKQIIISYGQANNWAHRFKLSGKFQIGDDVELIPEKEIILKEWNHSQKRINIKVEQPSSTSASGSMDLSDYFVNIALDESKVLSVAQIPEGYSASDVEWSSSDEQIATVNSSGTVNAKAEGTCVVTAKTKDGTYKSDCTISVTKDYIYKGVWN